MPFEWCFYDLLLWRNPSKNYVTIIWGYGKYGKAVDDDHNAQDYDFFVISRLFEGQGHEIVMRYDRIN